MRTNPTPTASWVDADLLERWREGVSWAGQELLRRHYVALDRFFRRRAGDDAQELVQRSFLACLEKRDTLRDAGSFRAFLFGVARLELLRHVDQRRRRPDPIDPAQVALRDPQPVPSSIVVRSEQRRRLARALPRLPRELQIVVALHYWEHLPTVEIAAVVGIPVGTVKSRLRRAKQQLFAELGVRPGSAWEALSAAPSLETWARALDAGR
ncbi:MAG: sigma-70 family RNA polymerase sigma factor [Deltaproteobacteria bacterium]|nr:sigma-70 family RNA polymerase sigma factor [Deltaproteobacteria bacterium]